MELKSITDLVDGRPFGPFKIELDNGRSVTVHHPEDIFFIPNRMKLLHITAYDRETDFSVIFHPCAVTALIPVRNGGSGA